MRVCVVGELARISLVRTHYRQRAKKETPLPAAPQSRARLRGGDPHEKGPFADGPSPDSLAKAREEACGEEREPLTHTVQARDGSWAVGRRSCPQDPLHRQSRREPFLLPSAGDVSFNSLYKDSPGESRSSLRRIELRLGNDVGQPAEPSISTDASRAVLVAIGQRSFSGRFDSRAWASGSVGTPRLVSEACAQ